MLITLFHCLKVLLKVIPIWQRMSLLMRAEITWLIRLWLNTSFYLRLFCEGQTWTIGKCSQWSRSSSSSRGKIRFDPPPTSEKDEPKDISHSGILHRNLSGSRPSNAVHIYKLKKIKVFKKIFTCKRVNNNAHSTKEKCEPRDRMA